MVEKLLNRDVLWFSSFIFKQIALNVKIYRTIIAELDLVYKKCAHNIFRKSFFFLRKIITCYLFHLLIGEIGILRLFKWIS